MTTYYYASTYAAEINARNVVKETAKKIWLENQMSPKNKDGFGYKYCASWQEAKDFLVSHFERNVKSAEITLAKQRTLLQNAQALKPIN